MSIQQERDIIDLRTRVTKLEAALADLLRPQVAMPTNAESPLDPNKPSVFGSILRRKHG